MKDIFKGFYNLNDNNLNRVWEDPTTMFVFDTNVFLNLYGYAQQTRDDFFKIIEALGNRIWIPYQIGLEYQRRRLDVIKNEKAIFKGIDNGLAKIQGIFKSDFEQLALKRRFPRLFKNTEKLEKEIEKCISDYKKSVSYWDDKQPCVRSHDEIREKINIYFNGRVGNKPLNQQYLDDICRIGKERYEKKIPPGFKDSNKSKGEADAHFYYDGLHYEKQYGDLILWNQIIEKAKDENIASVVFITDDTKDDWWLNLESNGKKAIGPLPELQAEIYRESKIANFHMYTTSLFLEDGKSKLKIDVDSKSIEDAIRHESYMTGEGLSSSGIYILDNPESFINPNSLPGNIISTEIDSPEIHIINNRLLKEYMTERTSLNRMYNKRFRQKRYEEMSLNEIKKHLMSLKSSSNDVNADKNIDDAVDNKLDIDDFLDWSPVED